MSYIETHQGNYLNSAIPQSTAEVIKNNDLENNYFADTISQNKNTDSSTPSIETLELQTEDTEKSKTVLSGVINVISNIFSPIVSFFSNLFGIKPNDEASNETIETCNEITNTPIEGVLTGIQEESDLPYLGTHQNDYKVNFDVADEVIEELNNRHPELGISVYLNHDSAKVFYDEDGELVITIPDDGRTEYGNYGEVRYNYLDLNNYRDMVGIAVNVQNNWEPSKENLATRDGIIGNTKQGHQGDCWLLSGVNALSYTEKGKEIIKNALEYHDNYTTVHLKGAKDYDITNEELEQARKKYSTGDDDMLLIELAVEKAHQDIAVKNINLDYKVDNLVTKSPFIDNSIPKDLFYLLTGKDVDSRGGFFWHGEEKIQDLQNVFAEFQQNGNNDLALALSIGYFTDYVNPDGETITLKGPHSYAVKEINDDFITFVDPWDSSIDLTISKDTAAEIFDSYNKIDLSDKNPEYEAKLPALIYEDGTKIYSENNNGEIHNSVYSADGRYQNTYYFNPNTSKLCIWHNGSPDDEYQLPNSQNLTANQLFDRIVERNLFFTSENYNLEKIVELGLLSESEWEEYKNS